MIRAASNSSISIPVSNLDTYPLSLALACRTEARAKQAALLHEPVGKTAQVPTGVAGIAGLCCIAAGHPAALCTYPHPRRIERRRQSRRKRSQTPPLFRIGRPCRLGAGQYLWVHICIASAPPSPAMSGCGATPRRHAGLRRARERDALVLALRFRSARPRSAALPQRQAAIRRQPSTIRMPPPAFRSASRRSGYESRRLGHENRRFARAQRA